MRGLRCLRAGMLGLMGLVTAMALAACGGGETPDSQSASASGSGSGSAASASDQPLVLYCGRSKSLIQPLIENFREETGIDVQVRYGSDAQLVAMLREEGSRSPADLYWANTPGALGAAAEAGLLTELSDSVLGRPAAFVPSSGRWVPLTTRFRTLAYNTDKVDADQLPDSVMDIAALEQFSGRVGWTPTYSSFQDFVTALRVNKDRPTAKEWLQDLDGLDPKAYSSNTPMIRALAAGEIDIALTNHYYILQLKHGGAEGEYEGYEDYHHHGGGGHGEPDPEAPVAMHRFEQGDLGNLALVTGGAVLKTSDQPEAAQRFLQFLLKPESQQFAAEAVHEYPVVSDAQLPDRMLPIDEALKLSPEFDFERLGELEETLKLMREAGLL